VIGWMISRWIRIGDDFGVGYGYVVDNWRLNLVDMDIKIGGWNWIG